MIQMPSEQIIARIYGMKRGYCFTPKDFFDLGSPSAVWQALSRLEKKGTIRKIMRGVYDYPEKNSFLEGYASPDPDRVARTIARSNGWHIVPDGNTALNLLGLSTQIPAEWSYLSDGPNRHYRMDTIRLTLKKGSAKETSQLSWNSAVLVQGIKAQGCEAVTPEIAQRLGKFLAPSDWKKTIKECRYVTAWVLEVMKEAAAAAKGKEPAR
jgi:hypothetical protein